jgi:hypothetical protein
MTPRGFGGVPRYGIARRIALAGLPVLLLALALAGCSKGDGKALPKPKPGDSSTSTTAPADYTQVGLIGVDPGKAPSTTRPSIGEASIAGRVLDSDGAPVPQALVRATYFPPDPSKPEVIEVLSGDDGGYRFEKLLGGRWRIRAFKAPQLATLEEPAIFLGAQEQKALDLKVKAATGLVVTAKIAPDVPLLGWPAELAARVFSETVTADGAVARTAVAGAPISLSITGSWSLQTPNAQSTDTDGVARWTMSCGAEGTQPISAVVNGQEFPVTVPSCLSPASTTTTTLPPPSSSTSSTKPKAKPTTTSSTIPRSYSTSSTRPHG